MLSIKNLSVHYGGIHALRGISLDVPAGKIVTLIGANGAGKSTTLNSIMGLVKADSGLVSWNGKDIFGAKTKTIVESGIVLVPEGRRVPNLNTVCVPEGVGLRIHTGRQALGSYNYADRGLARSGDTWTRAGFETAAQRIELDTDANLGSITLNPEAGCG